MDYLNIIRLRSSEFYVERMDNSILFGVNNGLMRNSDIAFNAHTSNHAFYNIVATKRWSTK